MHSDKRVAILSPVAWRTPPRQYGAWETVASNITEGLVALGWDVTLFATRDSVTRAHLHAVVDKGYEEDRTADPKVAEYLHISEAFEHAAEEAERLSHKHVGTEHLLLGLLREEKCFAAEILHERGLHLSTIREELARTSQEKAQPQRQRESSLLNEFSRDLTQAAMDTQLDPLVGRESELERMIHILCRRTKNNPVLIGEAGVGKTAIVEGLAQRIADGYVPSFLADKMCIRDRLQTMSRPSL